VADLDWGKIEASEAMHKPIRVRQLSSWSRRGKRLFDIVFALVGLAITVVLAPFIMLAIYIEDGRPFFFSHTRETRGGKNFKCHKFRTMWNNAEEIKKELVGKNQSDGPQFHMKDDPRVSRVGKFLRKTNLDELPQFWNVLVGEMSIVGPRPSPYKENQFCPPWREARLSVRPGITGLWQVKRSRLEGIDFQEWIRYDTYYVENMSWKHDLSIIFQTLRKIVMMG
jgi:lipopolysaccharide/colanic/teichoic acid biosynthesis glycosyltransferase